VQHSPFYRIDSLFQQRAQGQQRHRYYSQSTKVQVLRLVIRAQVVFWAQRIITERVVFPKRAFGVGGMPVMLAIRSHRSRAASGMAVVR
jgi:hypothetical protein